MTRHYPITSYEALAIMQALFFLAEEPCDVRHHMNVTHPFLITIPLFF